MLLSVPEECRVEKSTMQAVKPLNACDLHRRLQATKDKEDTQELTRILWFSGYAKQQFGSESKQILKGCLLHENPKVSEAAAFAVLSADDTELFDLIISNLPADGQQFGGDFKDQLIATSIVRRGRDDLSGQVRAAYVGWAAANLGDAALDRLEQHWGNIVRRALMPVSAVAPQDVGLTVEVSDDGLTTMKVAEDLRKVERSRDLTEIDLDELNDTDLMRERFREHQQSMIRKLKDHEAALKAEDAHMLYEAPQLSGLKELVARSPDQVLVWLSAILETHDPQSLRRIRNHGLALAEAYASVDPAKAAQVFRHLKGHSSRPNVSLVSGALPLYEHLLFSGPNNQVFTDLKFEVFDSASNDAVLESATFAAEACEAGIWLDTYVETKINDVHPAANARALTVAGFRQSNAQSERVLNQDWGSGFLGQVAQAALKNYQRAGWARHWPDAAAKASEGVEFWRFTKLAESVVDRRYLLEWKDPVAGTWVSRTEHDWKQRFKRNADKRTRKRKDLLFGLRAPDPVLRRSFKRSVPST